MYAKIWHINAFDMHSISSLSPKKILLAKPEYIFPVPVKKKVKKVSLWHFSHHTFKIVKTNKKPIHPWTFLTKIQNRVMKKKYSKILRIKIKSVYVKDFLISTKVRLKRVEHLHSEEIFSCELYFNFIFD